MSKSRPGSFVAEAIAEDHDDEEDVRATMRARQGLQEEDDDVPCCGWLFERGGGGGGGGDDGHERRSRLYSGNGREDHPEAHAENVDDAVGFDDNLDHRLRWGGHHVYLPEKFEESARLEHVKAGWEVLLEEFVTTATSKLCWYEKGKGFPGAAWARKKVVYRDLYFLPDDDFEVAVEPHPSPLTHQPSALGPQPEAYVHSSKSHPYTLHSLHSTPFYLSCTLYPVPQILHNLQDVWHNLTCVCVCTHTHTHVRACPTGRRSPRA